jgi:hypothetical protein
MIELRRFLGTGTKSSAESDILHEPGYKSHNIRERETRLITLPLFSGREEVRRRSLKLVTCCPASSHRETERECE